MELGIRTAVDNALESLGMTEVVFVIEHPTELSHGDYACNVAMVIAKDVGKAPREIAELLQNELEGKIEHIDRIEVAGPGFINFYVTRKFLAQEIDHAVTMGNDWGKNKIWEDKTVIVEYTDPNPFKELHIGHIVPNALGESLARLFMFSGADTKRVTFQGDVGMHVAKALWALLEQKIPAADITADILGKAYAAGSKAFEEGSSEEIKALNKKIYEKDTEIIALYDAGKAVSLSYFEKAYAILGSSFDHNFFESVTGPVGLKIVKEHIGDIFTESNGAVIFEGEKYGLHTRVFINSEGLPTYETKDVGLISCKEEWCPFDVAITVTGTEQLEYFKVTTKASELIQPELAGKVELVANGMLQLSEGKMSSRTGNVVRALDLIADVQDVALTRMQEGSIKNPEGVAEEVAVAAIKYTILKIGVGKDIIFDKEKALSFEGDSGPYLQYTHARIVSVLEKAKDAGIKGSITRVPHTPYEIEKILYRFGEVIESATRDREPHQVVGYLTELASMFNSFYAQEKIADEEDEYASYKVLLTDAVRQTLKNGLWVLGIKSPERM